MNNQPSLIKKLKSYNKKYIPTDLSISELDLHTEYKHSIGESSILKSFDTNFDFPDDLHISIKDDFDEDGNTARNIVIHSGADNSQKLANTYTQRQLAPMTGQLVKILSKNLDSFKSKEKMPNSKLAPVLDELLLDLPGTGRQFLEAMDSIKDVPDIDVVETLHRNYTDSVISDSGLTSGADIVMTRANSKSALLQRLQLFGKNLWSLSDISPLIADVWGEENYNASIINGDGTEKYSDEAPGKLSDSDFFKNIAGSLLYKDTTSDITKILTNSC